MKEAIFWLAGAGVAAFLLGHFIGFVRGAKWLKYAVDYSTLYDLYITSVSQRDEPVWTDKHLKELMSDFYLIPKGISDRYKNK